MQSATINPFGTNDLQGVTVVDTLRFFAHGTELDTVGEDRYSEGRIGLSVEDRQQIAFEDLNVRGSSAEYYRDIRPLNTCTKAKDSTASAI